MRILIADDDRVFCQALAAMIRGGGHEVAASVHSGLEAIRAYRQHKPDVVFMDFSMDKLNGLTACRNILSSDPDACVYLITGLPEQDLLAARGVGVRAIFQKPIIWQMIVRALEDAVAYRSPFRSITASAA